MKEVRNERRKTKRRKERWRKNSLQRKASRAPSNFRICGKCGSRLQKRNDRRSDWGSNLKDTTATKDDREAFLKKLRKLGELKDKGMLSDEEFQVAKASLLK